MTLPLFGSRIVTSPEPRGAMYSESMALLIEPEVRFHTSFLEFLEEWGDGHIDGAGLENVRHREQLRSTAGFDRLVDQLRADAEEDSPRPSEYVPCTYLWLIEGAELVGFLAIRHRLTPYLLNTGGHIGFSVRPSQRRRGLATQALEDALPVALDLGIGRVLVTCDEDNVGSARTIEKNGGVIEDTRGGKRRYWIDVSQPSRRSTSRST